MVTPLKVSASLLGADLSRLAEAVKEAQDGGCDELHFDVMDGHFVPNISLGLPVLQAIRPLTKLPIEAHMMVTNPLRWVNDYAPVCDIYTFHIEADDSPREVLAAIRKAGIQAGLAINPDTAWEKVAEYLPLVDRVLVMSVNPGAAGQSFISTVLPKITALTRPVSGRNTPLVIGVDGGIKVDNAHLPLAAGASVLVAATGLFRHPSGVRKAVELVRAGGL